jgi:hypothetical protein
MTKIEIGKTYKFRLFSAINRCKEKFIFIGKRKGEYVFMSYRHEEYGDYVNIVHLDHFRHSSFVTAKVLGTTSEINWVLVDPKSVVFTDD